MSKSEKKRETNSSQMKKKRLTVGFIVLVGLAVLVVSGFLSAKPPAPHVCDTCEEEGGQQGKVLSGELGKVDPAKAALLSLKINELGSEETASKIAEALAKQEFFCRIQADLDQKIFVVEYDREKTNKEEILKIFENIGLSAQIIEVSPAQSSQ